MRRLLLRPLLFGVACGGGRRDPVPEPEPAPAEPASEDESEAVTPEAAPTSPRGAPDEGAIAAAADAHRRHLRDGRRLANERRWDEAIQELEAAVAASPNHGPTLGELGFVDHRAERYAEASRTTRAALDLGPLPYRGDGVTTVATARGECGDAPYDEAADPDPPDDPSPTDAIAFEADVIRLRGGDEHLSFTASEAFCGLEGAPDALSCP
jgi:tetratricopeptide (TPR) repeat protein